MTRISDLAQHQRILGNVLAGLDRIRDSQAQVASGQKAQDYTGIARDTAQLISAELQLSRVTQYIENGKFAGQRLDVMDQAIGSIVTVASDLKRMLIQASDATSGSDAPVAEQASNMLDIVVKELNTKLNGRFLFSGSQTQTPPIASPVPDPAVFGTPDASYYRGDAVELVVRADDELAVTYGITGDRSGFQKIIGALKAAIQGDNADQPLLLERAIELATEAIQELTAYQTEIGSKQNTLLETIERHEDFSVYATGIISDIENVDIPLAVTKLAQDQTIIEAAFATLARLGDLSLTRYLR
jgi:flagellar hook-associated protein 3 FlgL